MAIQNQAKKAIVDYDAKEDILFLSRGKKIKDSLDLGNIILDFDQNDNVAGVEILNASKTLSFSKKLLSHIQKAMMKVMYRSSSILIIFKIMALDLTEKVTCPIPLNPFKGRDQMISSAWVNFSAAGAPPLCDEMVYE